MKRILTLVFYGFIIFSLTAQDKGSIDDKTLDEIRNSFKRDSYYSAVNNAVSNNSIKELALNRENLGANDHYFEYEVNVKGITDQKQSGRCWMFTGLNVTPASSVRPFSASSSPLMNVLRTLKPSKESISMKSAQQPSCRSPTSSP